MIGRLTLLALCCTVVSCSSNEDQEQSFYTDVMATNDVWRLPLIEPYQLITAYCCEGWNCGPGSALDKDFGFAHSSDSINVENSLILIHTRDSGPAWFALDLRTKQRIEFEDRRELNAFTTERGFPLSLQYTRTVFERWRSTGQLPWARSVLSRP